MNVLNYPDIGNRIRNQRELLKYSREQLAEKLGVTPKFCSDIELGVKGMSVQTLCKIAVVLCMSTDYILFGTAPDNVLPITNILKSCEPDILKFGEEILKNYVLAVNLSREKQIV